MWNIPDSSDESKANNRTKYYIRRTIMIQFKSTTTPKSERQLANTLGYPETWHVVRICPHPLLKNKPNSFQDIIYAGDPEIADCYFNHTSAMDAAIHFKEGESTPFDDYGGQLSPLVIEEGDSYEEGDEVEVYYDQDRKWYVATILEVLEYRDDVRFVVKYEMDEATQTNVCLEKIRKIKSNKSQSKKRKAIAVFASPTADNDEDDTEDTPFSKKGKLSTPISPRKRSFATNYVPDTIELQHAAKMGLPEGWAVNIKPNSRFTFYSPEGEIFKSKKVVYSLLGLPLPKHGYNPFNDDNDDNAMDNNVKVEPTNVNEGKDPANIEEGDPPWRTTGHELIGRRIEYTFPDENISGKGTITGWISETDVDKEGNPGFVSEKTNEAARLFHATMDTECPLASQDFEEYEVDAILIDWKKEEK